LREGEAFLSSEEQIEMETEQGRFSEGQEQNGDSEEKHMTGHFSEGQEKSHDSSAHGHFSEGQEKTEEHSADKERKGSFSDEPGKA
jgi:hypothetical protein